jgi:hypothetical protein
VPENYFQIGINQEIINSPIKREQNGLPILPSVRTFAEGNNSYAFLIASPTKAICDMIVATPNLRLQSVKAMQNYLTEDLRIDFEDLKTLDKDIVKQCVEVGRKKGELELLLKLLLNYDVE